MARMKKDAVTKVMADIRLKKDWSSANKRIANAMEISPGKRHGSKKSPSGRSVASANGTSDSRKLSGLRRKHERAKSAAAAVEASESKPNVSVSVDLEDNGALMYQSPYDVPQSLVGGSGSGARKRGKKKKRTKKRKGRGRGGHPPGQRHAAFATFGTADVVDF